MKKEKRQPFKVLSRESLDVAVADTATLKIEYAAAKVEMELEIAEVQKRHQKKQLDLSEKIEIKEAGIFVYCQQHRAELFPVKKSIDFLLATVGFRTDPHSVETKHSKDTWGAIAKRLDALDWGDLYVKDAKLEVNKQQLLLDRAKLTPEQLNAAGIRFEQEEQFFIEPKSDVAETSTREVA